MPTNDFLSWASGGSANIMGQSDYAGSAARTNGVQAGTASSALANKAWRQSANVAAMIGKFIVDHGYDALDNGDVAALEVNYELALAEFVDALIAAGATPFATLSEVIAGTATGKAVDPAKLAAAIHSGTYVSGQDTGAANALALTLTPAPPLYSAGMEIKIAVANRNTGATTINVNGLGAKAVVNTDGSPLVAGTLLAGQIAELVYDGARFQLTSSANAGAKYWRMTSTGASLPDSTLTVVSGYGASASNMPASSVNASAGTVTIGAADAGVYVITTSMAAAGDGVSDLVFIQVNGTSIAATQTSYPTNIAANDPSTAAVIALNSGDVVRIVYYQVKTGGGTTAMVNDVAHHFSAVRISR